MTEVMDQPTPATRTESDDLVAAIQQVLQASPEPLTVPKIRSQLPPSQRGANVEECLTRQVAANVLFQYPKYRSQQDRFWDRPMPVHISYLLRQALAEGPLAWSELRRKLPAYALDKAEVVFQEEITKGRLYRHPRTGRGGDRFGVERPDPKDYLGSELNALFGRLEHLGFSREQLRTATLELLHDEEWGSTPAAAPAAPETAAPAPAPVAPAPPQPPPAPP